MSSINQRPYLCLTDLGYILFLILDNLELNDISAIIRLNKKTKLFIEEYLEYTRYQDNKIIFKNVNELNNKLNVPTKYLTESEIILQKQLNMNLSIDLKSEENLISKELFDYLSKKIKYVKARCNIEFLLDENYNINNFVILKHTDFLYIKSINQNYQFSQYLDNLDIKAINIRNGIFVYDTNIINYLLNHCPNLLDLYIHGYYNLNINSLRNCKLIESVIIEESLLCNLSFLNYCLNLNTLHIVENNLIKDISPIKFNTKIVDLKLIELKELYDYSPLINLCNLEYLSLSYSNFKNLYDIITCVNLKYLDISSSKVTNINLLNKFPKLITLDISKIEVDDINSLIYLEQLKNLYIVYTKIKQLDLNVFKLLKNIEKINYFGTNFVIDFLPENIAFN
jgi:hypothetical protein